jgi:hypothetical protein
VGVRTLAAKSALLLPDFPPGAKAESRGRAVQVDSAIPLAKFGVPAIAQINS